MRVITGKVKGFKLKAPKGLNTRPTTDKVKESIFNILGFIKQESIVLDLFSGSGGIGIEFLSRGANECFFIDKDIESIKVIKENLEKTNFLNLSHVHKKDVFLSLNILCEKGIKFDYIFMDPPYNIGLSSLVLEEIDKKALLKKDGVLIVEHESKLELLHELNTIIKIDNRKYGDISASFYSTK